MIKTTVYLHESTKRRLARRAKELGVSEAELIRDGIERVVAGTAKRPTFPLFSSGDPTLSDPARIDEELRKGFGLR
ncbi:MAG: ribbon-helix-helix protein, CopG family [Chloroflexi bacterium]|nr:MAG: ribbon-helix-helix protein, CopG family [Chloroflexota bacterium]TMB79936.1 MAG: ribbon-helix-helix protein, CopG family [Chloroflexota bacterium]TMB97129.1 MAG: ribbon-helix-helix protein, CopG family [Chloroflexota bacterium]TMC30613.1 MAG: ribbon-helix-helix protein, CopG family [Chloroflexota bacterium]TMC34550.1 MAG: ribbon-helix-helix protein, CopG family [Chloroflexota bacterium]